MKKLILLVLMLPMVALSDPQPWMKKENPNELGIHVFVSPSCPVHTDEIQKMAENVLVRSRIKPIFYILSNPYIRIDVQCLRHSNNAKVFSVLTMTDFVAPVTSVNGVEGSVRFGSQAYDGTVLVADEDLLQSSLRRDAEDAIADFLKANFDLGEDE